MPTEVRFAVARDDAKPVLSGGGQLGSRKWWQLRREEFATDWDERKLFDRRASALAIIWRQRDNDSQGHYRFVLVRVIRKTRHVSTRADKGAETQEAVLG
jgi:hypothetical protein